MASHKGAVFACVMSGEYALTAGYDQCLKLWRVSTGQHLRTIHAHNHIISSIIIVANGTSNLIVSGSWDQTVKVWNMGSGKLIHCLNGHTNRVRCLSNCMWKCFASGGDDGQVIIWDSISGQSLLTISVEGFVQAICAHFSSMSSNSFSLFASGSGSHALLRLWTVNIEEQLSVLSAEAAISPSCMVSFALTEEQSAMISSHFTTAHKGTRTPCPDSGSSIAPDNWVLAGTTAGQLYLWSPSSGSILERSVFEEDSIVAVNVLEYSRDIFVLSRQGMLFIALISGATRLVNLCDDQVGKYALGIPQLGRGARRFSSSASLEAKEINTAPAILRSWTSRESLRIDPGVSFHCCCTSIQEGWALALVGGTDGLLMCHPFPLDDKGGQDIEENLDTQSVSISSAAKANNNPDIERKPLLPPISKSSHSQPDWNSSSTISSTTTKSFWASIDTNQLSFKRSRLQVRAHANARLKRSKVQAPV